MRLSICNLQSTVSSRRSGLSLTEVLLAIFVMGIGMLSLLVLFPIGIQNMSSALNDSRRAAAAANAEVLAEMPFILPAPFNTPFNLRNDPMIELVLREELPPGQSATSPLPASPNPFFNTDAVADGVANGAARFVLDGPSPPVFVDPLGTLLWPAGGSSSNAAFMGRCLGVNTTPVNGRVQVAYWNPATGTGTTAYSYGIRRVAPTFTAGALGGPAAPFVRRTFMIEDDITFNPNGEAMVLPGSTLVERAPKHSWAYMWRRPRATDTKVADLTVVMFQGRQVDGASFGNPPEPFYLGHNLTNAADGRAFTVGSTQVLLKYTVPAGQIVQTLPAKRGDLLLDATVIPPNFGNVPPILTHFNGHFYRIVGIGQPQPTGTPNEYYQELEINRPARADGYVGVMITGVADIIEKHDGRMPPG